MADLADALRGVGGWLGDQEAWALHEAVRNHPSQRAELVVVEIGSWKGRSTIALALGLLARGGGTVHAIDPHSDTRLHQATGERDTHSDFVANIRAADVERQVRCVRARSTAARAEFADRSVDVLFVDGSHLYEDILCDIDEWVSALADMATAAFHDAHAEPGVRRALDERVLGGDSPFHDARVVEGTLLTEFRRRPHAAERASGPSTAGRST